MKQISSILCVVGLALTCRGEDARKEDPAATKLLAEARASRAQWADFPGFKADIAVNIDGKVAKGSVEVSAKGSVDVTLDDAEAQAWAKRMLKSTVDHRIDNSSSLKTPCALADENSRHPLGQAITVLNDEFHSSYRVRDKQIIIVNRQMRNFRFTITVMENKVNADKKFLPVSYVVNSWDLKSDALLGSETFHNTWERVGKFDLPASLSVVKASAGKLEARKLTLSNFKLLGR